MPQTVRSDAALSNKAAVLRAIAAEGPISRVQLSKMTRLSKMCITNFVTEFLEDGYVVEVGTTDADFGRKPILLDISGKRPLFGAVQVTRHYISASLVNIHGDVYKVNAAHISSAETQTSIITKITNLLDNLITDDIKSSIWSIGVTSMGPVDSVRGKLFALYYSDGLENLDIVNSLSERYGLPIYAENDLNALALAEQYFGNAKDYATFAVVGSSIGLGCGIVCNGKLHTSGDGNCPEIGHVTVNFDGPVCYCGNIGCLEQYASIPKIVEWGQQQAQDRSIPSRANTWADLIDGARKGEPLCLETMQRLVHILGLGLLTIVNMFDPQCILLAEDYSMAADIMSEPLAEFINERKFAHSSGYVKVMASRFVGAAPLIAPAALAIDRGLRNLV